MKKKILSLATAFIFLVTASCASVYADETSASKIIAFPGAEGGGMYASGGRGCDVYVVTNLEDYGLEEEPIPGSLRDAVSQGNRTVVFNVSGNIELKRTLDMKYLENITIAGQTAPGDGITVTGYDTNVSGAKNLIIRYMRFRTGSKNRFKGDSMDAIWGRDMNNAIFDHISTSWSTDETMSLYRCTDTTVQWSITSESLAMSGHTKGKHGYGAIWSGLNSTYHHNLVAHHISRSPRISGGYEGSESASNIARTDIRNNVLYDYNDYPAYGGGWGETNFINNYCKPGPGTTKRRLGYAFSAAEKGKSAGYYFSGNYVANRDGSKCTSLSGEDIDGDGIKDGINYSVKLTDLESTNTVMEFMTEPYKTTVKENGYTAFQDGIEFDSLVTTQTAEEAYAEVLAKAGAVYPRRDAYDARVINEVENNKGHYVNREWQIGGLPVRETEVRPDNFDTDLDGMPDSYELENGLDPTNSEDGKALADGQGGYTNLEMYLNSLVDMDYAPENPEIEISSVSDNQQFALGEEIYLKADVTDNDGIEKVEFYNGDEIIGTDTEAPYEHTLKDYADGTYYISAKAIDKKGNKTQSYIVRLHVNTPNNSSVWLNADVDSGKNTGTEANVMKETQIDGSMHVNEDGSVTVKGQGVYLGQGGKKWEVFNYAYQPVVGDCEIYANLTQLTDIDNYAFAGVMIRNTLDYDSAYMSTGLTWTKSTSDFAGSGLGNAFQVVSGYRLIKDTYSKYATKNEIPFREYDETLGQYLKVKREGNKFSSYYSADGTEWTLLNEQEIAMNENVYIGFAVDSNQEESEFYNLNTSTFSDIHISGEGTSLDISGGNSGTSGSLGDVNEDGKVDFNDASLTLQYVLNKDEVALTENGLKNAKVCGEDDVTAKDAASILMKAIDDKFVFTAK